MNRNHPDNASRYCQSICHMYNDVTRKQFYFSVHNAKCQCEVVKFVAYTLDPSIKYQCSLLVNANTTVIYDLA